MKNPTMKTSYHETGRGEQLVQIIIIGLFFSAFFVAGGVLLIGSKVYDFVSDWWQEIRPEQPGDNY